MARPKGPGSPTTDSGGSKSPDAAQRSQHEDFLAAIDRLLSTVAELMQKEPALERQAFEDLRRLRVRIRFARRADVSDPVQVILAAQPPRFVDRADPQESVVDFLRREYSDWLGGQISRLELKKIDQGLYNALNNWISKHGNLPVDIDLPSRRELIQKKLQSGQVVKAPSRSRRASELSHADREQLRLYDVARHRKKKED